MPEVSRFFGMVVTMYWNDHAPPHFHVRYGGDSAVISIDRPHVLEGKLSARALALAIEWAELRQNELRADWELARRMQPLLPIHPLE